MSQELKARREFAFPADFPEIVCLCGSTRFFEQFAETNFNYTRRGYIVLSIGCGTKQDAGLQLTSEDKVRLDELHKRKIDLADFVFVINPGGYIGESTKSEIRYARSAGKKILSYETIWWEGWPV